MPDHSSRIGPYEVLFQGRRATHKELIGHLRGTIFGVHRIIGFTDEELGMVGSKFHAKNLSKEEITKIKAMINIDSVGLGPPSVWLNRADKTLAGYFYSVALTLLDQKLPL